MVTVAISNAKGGTGKTTLAVNLAAALIRSGASALLLDFDPQASATSWLGVPAGGSSLVEGLQSRQLMPAIVEGAAGIPLIPSGPALAVAGSSYLAGQPVPTVLRESLASVEGYGFCVVDCPPSLGPLAYNALAAASCVLVPCEASALALDGLAQFEQVVEALRPLNQQLAIMGVQPFRTNRTLHSRETLQILSDRYGARLLPPVPETVTLRDAAGTHRTIFDMTPNHPAALAIAATAARLRQAYP